MTVTFQGNPVTLLGTQLKVGDTFPNFTVRQNDLSDISLADTKGARIFLTVPSLDTDVCSLEVKKFNQEAAGLSDVKIYTISLDLPFAQARWRGNEGVETVVTASDYVSKSFAEATGTLIEGIALLTRTAFVVDADNKVVHVEYVPEITDEPNYESILTAAKNL